MTTIIKYPTIEIASYQYRYQRRTWWQLSSLIGQIQSNNIPVPKIKYTLNVHISDPAHELTLKLYNTFKDKIEFNLRIWDTNDFYQRGFTHPS